MSPRVTSRALSILRRARPRSATWMLAAVATASLIASLSLVQCSRSAAAEATADCTCAGTPVVDATLLAFLSKARAAHHRADLSQEDGDLDLAIAALEPVVASPHPTAPEAVEVIADTRARLADIRSELGDVRGGAPRRGRRPRARGAPDALPRAPARDPGRGAGAPLPDAQEAVGEREAADKSKAEALEAFRSAIEVQDQVIDEALRHVGH